MHSVAFIMTDKVKIEGSLSSEGPSKLETVEGDGDASTKTDEITALQDSIGTSDVKW